MSRLDLKPEPRLADKPSVFKRGIFSALFVSSVITIAHSAGFSQSSRTSPSPPAEPAISEPSAATSAPSFSSSGYEAGIIAKSIPASYTIRRVAREVRLQFTVADERGRLITTLSPGDIRVFDDQSAVARIRNFSRQDDLSLQIGILLDVSDSVQKTVLREKLATELFVQQVLRPATDRAFLTAFSNDVKIWQPSTSDPRALRQSLTSIHQLGSITNLYDALFYTCRNQFAQAGENDVVQRIVLLLSDGDDTGSLHTLPEAIAQAQRHDIQIYALSVHPKRKDSPGDYVLMRLAEETGGHFYVANAEKDFPALFDAMAQQMRTQYSVSFPPVRETAGFHSLRLETTIPQKVQVHARQAYYFDMQ